MMGENLGVNIKSIGHRLLSMSVQYQLTVFKTLTDVYPSWTELKCYLESEQGGHFRITEFPEKRLALIRYEKGVSNMSLTHSRWFRSVIWQMDKHLPVSLSPPKSTASPFPYSTKEEADSNGCVWSEFLDGFMINCFRIKGDPTTYIASRSKLDASGTFYSSKSFRQLFMEAFLGKEGLALESLEAEFQTEATKWLACGEEDESVSYSFLVQHHENRIVSPIERSRVVLIQKHILNSTGLTVYDQFTTFRDRSNGLEEFHVSNHVTHSSYLHALQSSPSQTIESWTRQVMEERPWAFQGLVCKDREGNRWRFRSDKYLTVKTLRGNCPSSLERFAQLYTQNLVHKYLEFYPEDSMEFSLNTLAINQVIQILFVNYINLHVAKSITIDSIDKMYLPHLYNLHGIYLTQLKSKKMKLVPMVIHAYFCKQPWQRIAFLIRKNKESYFQAAQ